MSKIVGYFINNNQVVEISEDMIKNKTVGIFQTDLGEKACLLEKTAWRQYQIIAEFPFYKSLDSLLQFDNNQIQN
jgi:hypothetical protein